MKEIGFPGNILERRIYTSRIEPFMRKSIIKVLSGQRRVGKSYLLFQLIRKIQNEDPGANIIYINKEDLQFDFIKNAQDLYGYVLSKSRGNERNFIFIDEIQDIDEFEKALRSLLLNENNDIYITGSNARLLSGELATYLSGRYIEFNIYSLSYSEFLFFHKLADTDDSMTLYFKYGGLPYLINLSLNDQVFEYLKSIYSTIVFRDVVNRYSLRNALFLEKLIAFLADNTGSLFSAKRISDFLRSQHIMIAHNQVQLYTSYLANAFLIHKVSRYDLIGRRIFETGEKYYFENLGIRNAIIGYKPEHLGKILENVVFNHLVSGGWEVKVGTLNNLEIDFICKKNNEVLYIQVALRLSDEKTIDREFGNLLKITDNYPKLVITNERFEGNTYEGIQHFYIRDFLMSKDFF